MKRMINISLYIVIFFIISFICIMSIKKFFVLKNITNVDSIAVDNLVANFVSYNEIEEDINFLNVDVSETILDNRTVNLENKKEENKTNTEETKEEIILEEDNNTKEDTPNETIYLYDNLTEQELIAKLEKSLKNELSGTGINFVNYYKTTGLEPYLAVAIVLHETGCSWTCSNLVKECFNYGGMRGGTVKYRDTNYTCYSSKEEGINAYLNMLYNNYYSKGLTTPELINPKYASSLEWSVKINNYIEKIKNA